MPDLVRTVLVNVALTTPLVGAYMMFALGIVFIYRASRVLNLAHGSMAMLPAYVSYAVAEQMGLGVIPGLIAALVVGAVLGLLVERVIVRRLRGASQTAQTVGTVGVLGLLIALAARGWGTTPLRAPSVFPARQFHVGNSLLQLGDIGLFVVALLVAAAFMALFRYTKLGLKMRCAADNRRAARLMGIDPDRTTAVAWAFAGVLAALGGVLLGASTNLHPYTLSLQVLPAFVAALLGGLESVPGAVVGSLVVGLAVGIVPSLHGVGRQVGAPQLALTALAFLVMSLRGRRFSLADSGEGVAAEPAARPPKQPKTRSPRTLSAGAQRRRARRAARTRRGGPVQIRARHVLMLWAVVYFPWLPGFPLNKVLPSMPASFVLDANQAGGYALVAFSLVLLTGWVGQISLGQGAFVGIGAFTTGLVVRRFGIPFPANLPLVALVTAAVAAMLGLVALRVRGLYLAVATLIFAWMCDAYLFTSSWLVGAGGSSSIKNDPIGRPGTYTVFDFSNKRVFYLVVLAIVGTAWYALVNLRDSKTGRAFFAVRGSEVAAVSLGIDVIRYKLMAFAVSGALAGIAGNLIMTNSRSATPVVFQFTVSLFFLSLAVVGGITSLGGAVGAGILFAALGEAFYRFSFLNGWLDVVGVALLLAVLLLYPGGLGAFGAAIRRRLRAGQEQGELVVERAPQDEEALTDESVFAPPVSVLELDTEPEPSVASNGHRPSRSLDLQSLGRDRAGGAEFTLPPERSSRTPLLDADGIVVRFGGLTAVDKVSVSVREHEIVGLIGPNGAGKTTTFNAIAGLNSPAAGTVRIFGKDATGYSVHRRAQMGVARTFQLIQLFAQLTVFDNLLVGTHVHDPTGLFSHLMLTSRAIAAERDAHDRVRSVVDLLDLGEFTARPVGGLPFGVLRRVEIARALVTGAPVLMLDEPASGLDNAETDELIQLLLRLRAELGLTVLLIEHDVRMVVAVCDYIYVMSQGKPLAQGTPSEIQRNPDVIGAYLGQADGAQPVASHAVAAPA